MSRKTDNPDLPEEVPAVEENQAEPEEFKLVKGGEELTVHRSALNYYLSAGWKRA